MLFTAWKMGVCPPRPSASCSARAFTSAPAAIRTRAQRVELNSAHTCSAETPRQEVKAHKGFSFRCTRLLDSERSSRSFSSSSSRTAWSTGSPTSAPASSMTCKHSGNCADRRYISIRTSTGRLPLIGSVGLTPAASTPRIPSGECSSNAPDKSAAVAKAPPGCNRSRQHPAGASRGSSGRDSNTRGLAAAEVYGRGTAGRHWLNISTLCVIP